MEILNSDGCIGKIYQNIPCFKLKKIFFHLLKSIFRWKMNKCLFFLQFFFFKLLLKLTGLLNSDDCIGKIISKSIRLKPVFIKKWFEVNKKQVFSSEKLINSGNCITAPIPYIFGRLSECTIYPNWINVARGIYSLNKINDQIPFHYLALISIAEAR